MNTHTHIHTYIRTHVVYHVTRRGIASAYLDVEVFFFQGHIS